MMMMMMMIIIIIIITEKIIIIKEKIMALVTVGLNCPFIIILYRNNNVLI
jgi:hypothetical protein